MLKTDTDPAKNSYSEYLETWKRGMEDIFVTALKNSTTRKNIKKWRKEIILRTLRKCL